MAVIRKVKGYLWGYKKFAWWILYFVPLQNNSMKTDTNLDNRCSGNKITPKQK